MSFVEIRSLAKRFGETPVFEDIDLDIERDSICVLVGPSGCGKTTLLRAVAGLTRQDHGTIAIDGKDIIHPRSQASRHRHGVSALRAVSQYDGRAKPRLWLGAAEARFRRRLPEKVSGMIELMGLEPRAKARPQLFRAGKNSASHWPARWCWSRSSSCLMSRCPRSMRKFASACVKN